HGACGRAAGHDPAGHDPTGYGADRRAAGYDPAGHGARAAEVTLDARRAIPAVERLLASEPFRPLLEGSPRALVLRALRDELAAVREALAAGGAAPAHPADAAWHGARVAGRLALGSEPSLRPLL